MSGQATGWVLRHGPKIRAQRYVLMTIADAANRDGEHAHPGIAAMVEGSLYSRARVLGVVAELLAEGWVEVEEEGGGRGRATVYRIPGVADGGPRKGPVGGPPDDANGPTTVEKGSNLERETVQSPGSAPIYATDTTEEHNASSLRSDVETLCGQLANRVAQHQGSPRPPITDRWRKDMRLLIERGPLHQEAPEPMPPERVAGTIAYIFDSMSDPQGRAGFCWAAQVRSPGALRDHWHQMAAAAERDRKARRGVSASAIDRVMAREPSAEGTLFTPPASSWGARAALGAGR